MRKAGDLDDLLHYLLIQHRSTATLFQRFSDCFLSQKCATFGTHSTGVLSRITGHRVHVLTDYRDHYGAWVLFTGLGGTENSMIPAWALIKHDGRFIACDIQFYYSTTADRSNDQRSYWLHVVALLHCIISYIRTVTVTATATGGKGRLR